MRSLKTTLGKKNLYEVIKMVLILSHRNAFVESGCSTNKQTLLENVEESPAVTNIGGASIVEITNSTLI